MKERRPQAGDANRQQQDPRQEAVGGGRAGSHRRRQRKRGDEKKHRQVPQHKGNQIGHHGLLTTIGGGLRRVTTLDRGRERQRKESLPHPPLLSKNHR